MNEHCGQQGSVRDAAGRALRVLLSGFGLAGCLAGCDGLPSPRHEILPIFLSSVNLLQNPSFENGDPNPKDGEDGNGATFKLLCSGSSSLFNWRVIRQGPGKTCGPNGNDAIVWYFRPEQKLVAVDGQGFVNLAGHFRRPGSQYGQVEQDVPTVPGREYLLQFSFNTYSTYAPPPTFRVTAQASGQSMNVDISQAFGWTPQSLTFKAVSPSTTIRISLSGSNLATNEIQDYIGLDKLSVRPLCSVAEMIWTDPPYCQF
jgi:hypothetical protein